MFEEMKKLQGKKKIEHYLEYYGLRTLGIIVVCGIIIFLSVHALTNKNIVSGVLAVNCDGDKIVAKEDSYLNKYLDEMGYDSSENAITINCRFKVRADYEDQVTRSTMETIQTMFVTKSFDVFLADEDFFKAIAQGDYLCDLSNILSKEEMDENKDKLVYVKNAMTQEDILAGIKIDNESSKWLKETGWYKEGAVIGLTAERKNDKLAIGMLNKFLD